MKIVYLDQNAASYLAMPESGSPWEQIRTLLVQGFERGDVCCPMPLETLVESAPCPTPLRAAIEDLFQLVGGGSRFRSFAEILVDATLALIRVGHSVVGYGIIRHGWAERESAAQTARKAHAAARQHMSDRLTTYQFPPGAKEMSVQEIWRSGALERSRDFQLALHSFVADPTADLSGFKSGWLMRRLIERSLTVDEAEQLSDAVCLNRWTGIPENAFDLLLGSQWEHDALHRQRPNYEPNDEVDRWRAAVALSRSDLFITDSYLAGLCQKVKIQRYTKTEVFSIKQTAEILAALRAP